MKKLLYILFLTVFSLLVNAQPFTVTPKSNMSNTTGVVTCGANYKFEFNQIIVTFVIKSTLLLYNPVTKSTHKGAGVPNTLNFSSVFYNKPVYLLLNE